MSARWQAQSAEGIIQNVPGVGILKIWSSKTVPTNALQPNGYAPGCEWLYTPPGGPPRIFRNVGGNGYYVGNAQNATANWFETGAGSTLYQTALAVANGISPSGTAALKIVDVYTLPANALNVAGRTLTLSIFGNLLGTSGHSVRVQIVANPTNTGLPSSGAGVAGATDGSVTVTGGTVVLDTGASFAPTYSTGTGFAIDGKIIKTGAAGSNTQESILTHVLPQAGLTSVAAAEWIDLTLTETAAIVFAVCVSAATTAGDITYQGCQITRA